MKKLILVGFGIFSFAMMSFASPLDVNDTEWILVIGGGEAHFYDDGCDGATQVFDYDAETYTVYGSGCGF